MERDIRQITTQGDEFSLLDVAAVLVRRWKTIALVAAGVVALAATLLMVRSANYTARTVLVPAPGRVDMRAQALSSIGSPLAAAGLIGLRARDPNERLLKVIFGSRSLEDSLIARILPPGGATAADSAQLKKILRARTRVHTNNSDGSYAVEVTAKDPELAARIAREYPEALNSLAVQFSSGAARQKLVFFESQLEEARERLITSEQRLLTFQQESDAPEVQEQARQTVQAAAELQMKVNEMEIHLARLRRVSAPDNPELRAAMAELGVRREQLRRLTANTRGDNPVFVPLRSSPELKVAATRLLRDFTRDEQIYISLTAALADAQIDVHDNVPVVSVIDPAIVPEEPSSAPPVLILLLAGILGMVLGVGTAFAREYAGRARSNPANSAFFVAWDSMRDEVIPLRLRERRRPTTTADR